MGSSSPPDVLMEERHNELMISPSGGNPTQKTAHFLLPNLHFSPSPPSPCSASSKLTTISISKKTHIKSLLKIHRHPPEKWKAWVDRLKPTYQEIWNQAGIYQSIMSSTQIIPKNSSLIIGLPERWCFESNTFIFPWGEATLTLEDMAVLGGYSVLGDSILYPLRTGEFTEIGSSLRDAVKEMRINRTSAVPQFAWMDYFMGTGKKFEHQAFLVFWVSRFVFIDRIYVTVDLFSVASHLANGTPIALAPAVLASIYRDLRLLKKLIVDNDCTDEVLKTTLSSPFQLVQLWAWKRFCGEPRLSQRQETQSEDVIEVRKALDSAEEFFRWRPYALDSSNSMFGKFYTENGAWVLVDSIIDKELEMYARCLRVSELVGLDCIEQYLPNRVAMQFGFDQDIPGYVPRSNGSSDDAWRNYNWPIRDVKLYVPARLYEAGVTSRYLKWYKGSTEIEDSSSWRGQRGTALLAQPVSPVTCDEEQTEDYIDDQDKMSIAELVRYKRKRITFSEAMCAVVEHVMEPQYPSASSLVENDIDIQQEKFVSEAINMSTELQGRPMNTMKETDSKEKKDPFVSTIHEVKGTWDGTTFKLPELEIDKSISRLEERVATLQAAKLKGKLRIVS